MIKKTNETNANFSSFFNRNKENDAENKKTTVLIRSTFCLFDK